MRNSPLSLSRISEPTISEGSRSMVNWTRPKSSSMACATDCTIRVLAVPGTPSSSRWPPVSSEMRVRSTTRSSPTTVFSTWLRTESAKADDRVLGLPWMEDPLVMWPPRVAIRVMLSALLLQLIEFRNVSGSFHVAGQHAPHDAAPRQQGKEGYPEELEWFEANQGRFRWARIESKL